jgi:hypothetical protein
MKKTIRNIGVAGLLGVAALGFGAAPALAGGIHTVTITGANPDGAINSSLCLGYNEGGRISILAVEKPDRYTRKVTFICY